MIDSQTTFPDGSLILGIGVIDNISSKRTVLCVNLKLQSADQFQVTPKEFVFPARNFSNQSVMQNEIIFTWGVLRGANAPAAAKIRLFGSVNNKSENIYAPSNPQFPSPEIILRGMGPYTWHGP
jgi:hypothetical protein